MKKYVEVDREPVVGDMVKIVNCQTVPQTDGVNDYKRGDRLRIIDIGSKYRYKNGYGDNRIERVLHRHEFVVVEELEQFTKSDLKPCMVVRLRGGELCIVVNYKKGLSLLSISGFVYTGIETFNDDLKRKYNDELFDVIEVYGLNEHGINAMDISTDNRDLLFKREEQSPRDIKIKELQDKMDAIKREMEELK